MNTGIVFIDSRVANYQTLIDGFTQPAEVCPLDSELDGAKQILARLQDRTNVDALHIISHDSDGALYPGNTVLTIKTTKAYSSTLGTTQTQTPSLSVANRSLWRDGERAFIHHTFDPFVVYLDDALDMKGTSSDIPIELGFPAGSF